MPAPRDSAVTRRLSHGHNRALLQSDRRQLPAPANAM